MSDPTQSTPPPSPSPPTARKPLGVLRGLLAALGVIIMVLTGGCALVLFGMSGSGVTGSVRELFGLVGLPFVIGLGIFLAATRLGRD